MYTDPTGHWKFKEWAGQIIGGICGVAVTIATGGNILAGFQAYSFVSNTINSAIAISDGADPLRVVGAYAAGAVLSSILPGGGTYDNLLLQVGVSAARGAVIGAVSAAIMGGDISKGAIGGGIAGAAIGFVSSNQFQNFTHGNGFQSNAQVAAQNRRIDNLQSMLDEAKGIEGRMEVAKIQIENAMQPFAPLASKLGPDEIFSTNSDNYRLSGWLSNVAIYAKSVGFTAVAKLTKTLSVVLSDMGPFETTGMVLGAAGGAAAGGLSGVPGGPFWLAPAGAAAGKHYGRVADFEYGIEWKWVGTAY